MTDAPDRTGRPRVPFLDVGAGSRELRADLLRALVDVVDSGSYILGEQNAAFEREFAAYCGVRHCIGLGNGLDAIQLLLRAHDIGVGDEVIVPAHTFIATWLGVTLAGATPVPVDVDPDTMLLNASAASRAITPRTRAILPVHLYGRPCDMTSLRELSSDRGLLLLVDAAQAQGAEHGGSRASALGDGAAFSFYPGKNLGAFGDAGAVVTDDDEIAGRLRRLRNYGSERKYHHDVAGQNSRLDELQAAVLRVKLQHLDGWNTRRTRLARRYLDGLSAVRGLRLPTGDSHCVWHLFVVRTPNRDALQTWLAQRGITTLVHYPIPPHRSGAYQSLEVRREDLPVTDALAREVLSLPFGPHLADDDADFVIEQIKAAATAGVLRGSDS